MQVCTECASIEQGTKTVVIDGEEIEVCAVCEMEDSMQSYDEDYGKDR